MHKNILLIEDNPHKRKKITDFISQFDDSVEISESESYTSGWQSLIGGSYSLVILDMSLPTYDVSEGESGGRFRTFGGKELARKMKRKGVPSNFFFVTQYESFNDVNGTQTLDSIKNELKSEYGDRCLGVIHFDTSSKVWKEEFKIMLEKGLK